MAHQTTTANDFVILGPALAKGNKVLEAIHSLYYLPENFKLIFTGNLAVDQSFYKEVVSLIERDDLASRVHFASNIDSSQAIILPNQGKVRASNSVTGDTAEALASAILDVARATA